MTLAPGGSWFCVNGLQQQLLRSGSNIDARFGHPDRELAAKVLRRGYVRAAQIGATGGVDGGS